MKRAAALLAALLVAACNDASENAASSLGEPMVVHGAQFFGGELPAASGGPALEGVESQNNVIVQGQAGKRFAGDARAGAMSLALELADLGSGYWVLPVGPADPATPGDLTWEAVVDFARDLPVGPHTLHFAAASADGAWGPRSDLSLGVRSIVPKGHVVIALSWSTPADLDLHVWAPDGVDVSPKTPTSALPGDAGVEAGAGDGVIDRDSNAACVDGPREEDLVFAGNPAPGLWSIYVDEFDACAAPTTTWTVVVYVDGAEQLRRTGRLLDADASGGARADGEPGPVGLFVTQLQF